MGIKGWAKSVTEESVRRNGVSYFAARPVPPPADRKLGRLSGETHAQAAERNRRKAADFAWQARTPTTVADAFSPADPALEGKPNLGPAGQATMAALGVFWDLGKAPFWAVGAEARRAAANVHDFLSAFEK